MKKEITLFLLLFFIMNTTCFARIGGGGEGMGKASTRCCMGHKTVCNHHSRKEAKWFQINIPRIEGGNGGNGGNGGEIIIDVKASPENISKRPIFLLYEGKNGSHGKSGHGPKDNRFKVNNGKKGIKGKLK